MGVAGGCELRTAWVTSGGRWVGHVFGAPEFVNRAFGELYLEGLPPDEPLLLLLAGAAGTAAEA